METLSGNEIELDITNWSNWNNLEVTKWIRHILNKKKFDSKEINSFINNTFENLNINGGVLFELKNDVDLWNEFYNEMKNLKDHLVLV